MLRQERIQDPEEMLRTALLGWQSEIWTSLPGIVQSYDPAKMTCVVQPAIQGIFRLKDGTTKVVTLPLCLDVPVSFPTGGGFTLTFPIAKGDEGLLVFGSRCIDAWWQNGGVQPQAEVRFHDLSDGNFIPGIRSVPRVLANLAADATELRSDDGTIKVSVKADQVNVKVKDATSIVVKDKEIDLTADDSTIVMKSGEIDITATTIKLNGIVWGTHEHTGVTAGGAKTGGPTGP